MINPFLAIMSLTMSRYNHFTTTVRPDATANYPYDVALHFVHHRSNRSDATPLLFIHGWPGSWMEVTKIIDSLTNPPNASLPAFHVVAPSIPGFGFSPAPQHDGLGPVAAGHVFQALMAQLGYDRFVIQAGDWGAAVLRVMASAYPEHVISALSNFWMRKPRASDRQALEDGSATADEAAYIRTYDNFNYNESGYRFIHQTAPLELAYALTDSPVGNAMWIDQLLQLAVTTPNFWSTEDIITWTMMYQIPGPYAGSRFYRLAQKDGFFENILDWGSPASARNIKPPIAISEFPADIWYRLPLSWAQRDGNIVKRFVHDRGGHFAATEVPELLLGDIWAFFGNSSLSNLTTSG